jgi:hypothetical protein
MGPYIPSYWNNAVMKVHTLMRLLEFVCNRLVDFLLNPFLSSSCTPLQCWPDKEESQGMPLELICNTFVDFLLNTIAFLFLHFTHFKGYLDFHLCLLFSSTSHTHLFSLELTVLSDSLFMPWHWFLRIKF